MPRWLIVIPALLALWGVLSERVALFLFAVLLYFGMVWYFRRGRIGNLRSVPADDHGPVGSGYQTTGNVPVTAAMAGGLGAGAGVPPYVC